MSLRGGAPRPTICHVECGQWLDCADRSSVRVSARHRIIPGCLSMSSIPLAWPGSGEDRSLAAGHLPGPLAPRAVPAYIRDSLRLRTACSGQVTAREKQQVVAPLARAQLILVRRRLSQMHSGSELAPHELSRGRKPPKPMGILLHAGCICSKNGYYSREGDD